MTVIRLWNQQITRRTGWESAELWAATTILPHSGFIVQLCLIHFPCLFCGDIHWHWCCRAHCKEARLSLKHPFLLVQVPHLRQGLHQLPSLLSVSSSSQRLCCHTRLRRDTSKLWDSRTPGNNPEMTLFWESLREFRAAEQGEILIKIPNVIWEEDSVWSWEPSGKHFPISSRLSWIFAFWLFPFTISVILFTGGL